jgi:hypothetical protein
VTSDGAEEFAVTGPAGGVSGRANDHCKTSSDMLTPRCPDTLLQISTVSRSQALAMCAASAECVRPGPGHPRGWTVSATEFIADRQRRAGANASRTGPLGATGHAPWAWRPAGLERQQVRDGTQLPPPAGWGPAPTVITGQANALASALASTQSQMPPHRGHQFTFESLVDTGLDGEHRTGGIEQDALGVGPQDQLANRSASAQADHDEVCVDLVGHLDEVL